MALAVVNYPRLEAADFDRIQSIRRAHDALFYDVIAPHFTIVFPTDAVPERVLIEHVADRIRSFRAFEVVLRCAIIGDPDFMDHAHAFLVPDEGLSEIVRVHDALYTGALAGELRLDLPFVPHIGIASTRTAEECKAVVDAVNANRFEIRGRVDELTIIEYDGKAVWTIATHAIPGGSEGPRPRADKPSAPHS